MMESDGPEARAADDDATLGYIHVTYHHYPFTIIHYYYQH